MYDYCARNTAELLKMEKELTLNFDNSIYTNATVNLGPHSVCYGHNDGTNSPKVKCAVTSMGHFDHTRGGHLVLPDFKIIIEFPPGWTILIPSASVRHGNTPIQEHERRYSFTQYIMGGLFRWVRYGGRLARDLSVEQRKALDGSLEKRLSDTLDLFTKYGEYQQDLAGLR